MAIDATGSVLPGRVWLSLRLLRVHQWSKNLLVFVPAALAGHFDGWTLVSVLVGFVSLSVTASCLYIVNDLIDVEVDRNHPLKRERPIAAGQASSRTAIAVAATLAALGLALAATLGARAVFAVLGYAGASLSYQLIWKKLLLADILMLALLYSFRLYAGSVYAHVEISDWLVVFAIFFFLGLAVMKRLVDLAGRDPSLAPPLSGYRPAEYQMLQTLGITASMTSFAVLALYVYSERGRAIYSHHELLWGVWLVVFYCVGRLWFSVARDEVKEDPVSYVLQAPYCQLSIIFALLLMLLARSP